MSRDPATQAQVRAARPMVSSWVSANAGSGKTRVLTDRVARLLLRGTDPRKILCLTYTKAAAAEMQNRLFDRLGDWAMRPDNDLRDALAALDEDAQGIADTDLAMARRLFAGALETPGGLKIQTIHSFCDALLRRFPLEAGVSPQFTVLEERQGAQLRQTLAEKLAELPGSGFAALVAHILTKEDKLDDLLRAILTHRDRFALDPESDALERAFGWVAEQPQIDTFVPRAKLGDLIAAIEDVGGKTERGFLPLLIALNEGDRAAEETLFNALIKPSDRTPREVKATKAVLTALADAQERLWAVRDWCEAIEDHNRLAQALGGAKALVRFGQAFIDGYDTAKRDLGALDFDDLIRLAKALLSDREASDWVAYKLDGGIDHVLVDEAQDTSPAQWDVIDAIVAEFFAGDSARDVARTLFVVGDEKQSIYSFQGAQPAAFGEQATRYRGMLADVSQSLEECELLYSFRSAPPILGLIDAVAARANPGLSADTKHRAFHDMRPGRVELWPFLEAEPKPDPVDPWLPVVVPKPPDPQVQLAGQVAARVALMVREKQASAGEVLILVRRRSTLFRAIIRGLKAEGVPVAGADRLQVMKEIAPRDLVALLKAVATPEDDLTLATALKSPIFGLSESALYVLATGRDGPLAEALLESETLSDTAAIYRDVRGQADYLRPYELLDRILTRHGARQRFAARLGPEAEDAITALQDLALDYEQVEPPTLTGFLDWLDSSDAERKRQLETGGGEVRVMTVHGAKGLEAPVVILPDTVRGGSWPGGPLLKLGANVVALSANTKTRPKVVQAEETTRTRLEEEEYARLLYVAITRAERWLIVCGAGSGAPKPGHWYSTVAQAMEDVGAVVDEGGTLVFEHVGQITDDAKKDPNTTVVPEPDDLPDWLLTPPGVIAPEAVPLTPSGVAEAAPHSARSGDGTDPETARRRGIWLHDLLEVLPHLPKADWAVAAAQALAASDPPADADDTASALTVAKDLLTDPDLEWIFGPDSLPEQEVCGRVTALNGRVIRGRIDRLVVNDDAVWAIDYKSDAMPPDTVPTAYATQLALYVAALREIFPDRAVKAAILWTRTRRLAPIDHEDVSEVLQSLAAH